MSTEENTRLERLKLYSIMDSAAEASFDQLTKLASMICDCPISLVSLVDDKRQWFKSRVGLDATETPREHAFCAHAIQQQDIFMIEDAQHDKRFVDNPLVTGEPHIRFYAGAPLTVEGNIRLGTLCVIDSKPRRLDPRQLDTLAVLRDAVVNLLELRLAQSRISAFEQLIPMCAWCKDINVKDDHWVPLHDYVTMQTSVTHGICPSCADEARKSA